MTQIWCQEKSESFSDFSEGQEGAAFENNLPGVAVVEKHSVGRGGCEKAVAEARKPKHVCVVFLVIRTVEEWPSATSCLIQGLSVAWVLGMISESLSAPRREVIIETLILERTSS